MENTSGPKRCKIFLNLLPCKNASPKATMNKVVTTNHVPIHWINVNISPGQLSYHIVVKNYGATLFITYRMV